MLPDQGVTPKHRIASFTHISNCQVIEHASTVGDKHRYKCVCVLDQSYNIIE